jgi:hypothetical protein
MTALTYGKIRVPTPESETATRVAAKAAPKKPVVTEAPRQGFFARFLAAMMEARLRDAERDIRLYAPRIAPLLPELRREEAKRRLDAAGGDTPRGGW